MRARLRLIILAVGLALVLFSLLALAYALNPAQVLRTGATLAPTLLTLPPGGLP